MGHQRSLLTYCCWLGVAENCVLCASVTLHTGGTHLCRVTEYEIEMENEIELKKLLYINFFLI